MKQAVVGVRAGLSWESTRLVGACLEFGWGFYHIKIRAGSSVSIWPRLTILYTCCDLMWFLNSPLVFYWTARFIKHLSLHDSFATILVRILLICNAVVKMKVLTGIFFPFFLWIKWIKMWFKNEDRVYLLKLLHECLHAFDVFRREVSREDLLMLSNAKMR